MKKASLTASGMIGVLAGGIAIRKLVLPFMGVMIWSFWTGLTVLL